MTENINPEPPRDIPEVDSTDTLGEAQPIKTVDLGATKPVDSQATVITEGLRSDMITGQVERVTKAAGEKPEVFNQVALDAAKKINIIDNKKP